MERLVPVQKAVFLYRGLLCKSVRSPGTGKAAPGLHLKGLFFLWSVLFHVIRHMEVQKNPPVPFEGIPAYIPGVPARVQLAGRQGQGITAPVCILRMPGRKTESLQLLYPDI